MMWRVEHVDHDSFGRVGGCIDFAENDYKCEGRCVGRIGRWDVQVGVIACRRDSSENNKKRRISERRSDVPSMLTSLCGAYGSVVGRRAV